MLIDRVTLTILVKMTVQIVIQAATTILNHLRQSQEGVSEVSPFKSEVTVITCHLEEEYAMQTNLISLLLNLNPNNVSHASVSGETYKLNRQWIAIEETG